MKRRAEEILSKIQDRKRNGPWTLSGEELRHWRVVEVLERIGTAGAGRPS